MNKFFIPIIAFVLVGVLLWKGLSLDPRHIPSPLIGKPISDFSLTQVNHPDKISTPKDFYGRVYLLNVWASWCVACRQEHPLLMEIKRNNIVPIIGLNYKDKQNNARGFLQDMGDPYEVSLADLNGRVGIDMGVYGVPETFVIDKQGIIRYRFTGPITEKALINEIMPVVRQHL